MRPSASWKAQRMAKRSVTASGSSSHTARAMASVFGPVSRNSAMVGLDSFVHVTGLLKHLQRTLGGQLSAYEVMWGDYFRAVTEPGHHRAPMPRTHAGELIGKLPAIAAPAAEPPR